MRRAVIAVLVVCSCIYAAVFTGAQNFWRPRQNMLFYLVDEQGGGFEIDFTLRDLNTYLEGERAAYVFVMGPDGKIIFRQFLPDDGITKNNYLYKDGIADEGMDVRYRSYRRHFGGGDGNKRRNPAIAEPNLLKPANYRFSIPDAGKGIYRVAIAGCWDHFITLTPSRKMSCGINPGAGPLYLHKQQLSDAYLYITPKTKDVYLGIWEEIMPAQWNVKASIDGAAVAEVKAGKGFFNYDVLQNAPKGKVLHIQAAGESTGANLSIMGIPFIVCEDEATAMRIQGGTEEAAVTTLRSCAEKYPELKNEFERLLRFSIQLGFRDYDCVGRSFKKEGCADGFRSSWWDFGDGWIDFSKLPKDDQVLKAAVTDLCEKWALNRYMMEQSITVNQWAKIDNSMANMYVYTQSPIIREALEYNVKRMCTQFSCGRVNPDSDWWKSGYEPDSGFIDNGIMAECLGHDCEYNLETDSDMSHIYDITGIKEILDYQNKYYTLKTYLTCSKYATAPASTFLDTFSETASNARTRFYTHKSGGKVNLIHYGDLWGGKENPEKNVWPFLEEKPFVRNLDGRYYAVNTGNVYALFFTGPGDFQWNSWGQVEFFGQSYEHAGLGVAGYGGWQWFQRKTCGMGFVWKRGYGPVLVASNHNLPYSNGIWGESTEQIVKNVACGVNPYIVSEALSEKPGDFGTWRKRFVRKGIIPRTPLAFKRTIKVIDGGICEEITLTAEEDCTLKSLYEAIPVPSDRREIIVNGKSLAMAPAVVAEGHGINAAAEGFAQNTHSFNGQSIQMKATDTGKSVTIAFDKPYEIITATPFRYRGEALGTTAFNVKLPLTWKKGDSFTIRYTIE